MKDRLVALLPAFAAAFPQSPDAEGLLAAHRARLGEPAALAGLGVVASRGKVVFEGFPAEGAYRELLAPSGAARVEAIFEGVPPSLRCTNGKLFWMKGTGGVEVKRGWSAAADVRLFALGRHRDWREVYAGAEVAGEAIVAGRACHELRLRPRTPEDLGIPAVPGEEPPAPDTWWLDLETRDLLRVAIYATVSGAGWQRLTLDYADWRAVGGVRFPHRSRLTFGPLDRPLAVAFTCESLETDAKPEGDPFQPDDAVFAELARSAAGDAPKDPGFSRSRRKPQPTATVRVQCAPGDVRAELATIFPEVMGYLQRERLAPVGPPFARTHSRGEAIDLEAGIPVAETVGGSGRVRPSILPGGEVVCGMHVGPYQDLGRTHEALAEWLGKNDLAPAGGPWEVYWTDPGLQRDPSKWRTEILQPVLERSEGEAASGDSIGAAPAAASGGDPGAAPTPAPDPELQRFGILVGAWEVTGGIRGRNSFEWLDGGPFLLQRFDFLHEGHSIKGIEVIGRGRSFGGEAPGADVTSRSFDNRGVTMDAVWELEGRNLTIWGAQKGSAISCRATFSEDGSTLTGGWKWPGGGYEFVATRVPGSGEVGKADPRGAR